jgi:hypothetical protein
MVFMISLLDITEPNPAPVPVGSTIASFLFVFFEVAQTGRKLSAEPAENSDLHRRAKRASVERGEA